MLLLIEKSKMLKMLLIKRTKCWRCCCWLKKSKYWRCCWSKGQNAEDVVADEQSKCWRCCWSKGQNVEDVVADRTFKVLKMLLIERAKCWRCRWKIKMLKMLLIKDWRCCWWWRLKIEDEDYMMFKSFQWFIDVLPWWCWWCPLSLSYSCCCFCCRIPFSLTGSVEIF